MESATFLFFAIVIGGIIIISIVLKRFDKQKRRQLPDEKPWAKHPQWSKGIIKDTSKRDFLHLVFFSVIWCTLSGIALWKAFQGNAEFPILLILGLFISIGVIMLLSAFYMCLQWYKFRGTRFVMVEVPGIIGGSLGGVIEIPHHVRPDKGFTITLECVRLQSVQSGRNRRVQQSVQWSSSQIIRVDASSISRRLTAIPVLFDIPFDVEPTAAMNEGKGCLWRLRLEAECPGLNLKSVFEVPVFRTEHSRSYPPLSQNTPLPEDEVTLQSRLTNINIHLSRTAGNDLLIEFPLSRHWGSLFFLFFSTIFLTAIAWATYSLGAPIIFPIVFGGMELLILFVTFSSMQSAQLKLTDDTLNIFFRKFVWNKHQSLRKDAIQTITARSWLTVNNVKQYNLVLKLKDNSQIRIPTFIPREDNTQAILHFLARELNCPVDLIDTTQKHAKVR